MSLVLTFSSCQRARAGPVLRSRGGKAALCPKRFYWRRELAQRLSTHMETHINTYSHTHTHTSSVFSLSAARPKRTKCLKWTRIRKAHLHTSTHAMLITQVSCLCLSFSKAIETWGWWTQPWSNNVGLGLQTWQMTATRSVEQCVCSESSITNDTAVLYGTTITERCSHVFPCRAANQPDGNRNLLLWMVFLPLATTVERTTGSNFNWEYISLVAFFERLFPCFTIATFFWHLWLWKNQLIRHIVLL